jgi:hypothetical protein
MYRKNPSPLVEVLESRTLLSGAPPLPTPVDRAAVSERTTTVLNISTHRSTLGQPLKFTITVKAAPGAGTPAGTVRLIDNGATVAGAGAELVLTLSPKGRATYTFQVGNIGVFAGIHTFSALYTPSNTLLGSISKPLAILVKVPKIKRASDGLGVATIQPGHGPAITDGQTATVSYTGFLQANGEVFDYATANHGADAPTSLTFTVLADPEQVINGFDRAVRGMKVGETRVVAIPAALGYGPNGSGSSVPPNADLLFFIKLLSIT